MAKKENKIENYTSVDGVVLTEKGISFLKNIQGDNNNYIKEYCEDLNNTISILIDHLEGGDDESDEEILIAIKMLNSYGRQFKSLMKP